MRRPLSEQNGTQVPTLQRPTTNDPDAWKTYWAAQGWHWRTEPEIDTERQKYLAERRAIKPDIEQGIYPFKDIKLSRADVEWLLVTHENGRGPVDWSDKSQRERWGLDLRGANLCQVDLSFLPLARLRGGLGWEEWFKTTEQQRKMATVLMVGANLVETNVNGANLVGAELERADLRWTELEIANLRWAQLNGANLVGAQLNGAYLRGSNLESVNLSEAKLDGAYLKDIVLGDKQRIGPQLADVQWGYTNLALVDWSQVRMLGDEYKAHQRIKYNEEVKDCFC